MQSHEINRAILAMDSSTVRLLLERIAKLEVEITKKPETGLVMMNVTDCFDTDFHLGEVLVTTAEVRVADMRGWGMIMGDESERAILLACIDGILQRREIIDLWPEIERELSDWLKTANEAIEDESKLAATTRVNFESMAEG